MVTPQNYIEGILKVNEEAKVLMTSDWHLTDDDDKEYRWCVFENLKWQINFHKPGTVVFAGDLTDKKSGHSEVLVNRLVAEFNSLNKDLAARGTLFYFVVGNHDYLTDPKNPFFKFLNVFSNIEVVVDPTVVDLHLEEVSYLLYLIPHRHTPIQRRSDIVETDLRDADVIIMHETFNAAKASNGMKMEGSSTDMFKFLQADCFSGDIHVPQKLGPITYIGTPHPVHFGDVYKSRMLLLRLTPNKFHLNSITFEDYIKRAHIQVGLESTSRDFYNAVSAYGLRQGDHVKVTIKGSSQDLSKWAAAQSWVKQCIEDCGFVNYGIAEKLSVRVPLLSDGEVSEEVRDLMLSTNTSEGSLLTFSKAFNLVREQVEMGKKIIRGEENV